jgi:hypothetical protein
MRGMNTVDQSYTRLRSVTIALFLLTNLIPLVSMTSSFEAQTYESQGLEEGPPSRIPTAHFTENVGQVANEDVHFYGSPNGIQFGFEESAVLVVITESSREARSDDEFGLGPNGLGPRTESDTLVQGVMVRAAFQDSNPVIPRGRGQLPHLSNYFLGKDPNKWHTGVRSFQEIVYEDLYDGIDLVYGLTRDGLKYDFIVAPSADPNSVVVAYEGVERLSIEKEKLVVSTSLDDIHDSIPYSFQESGQEVHCEFEARTESSFGFDCGEWDNSQQLTIDPLIYSTFLGGSDIDKTWPIAVDSSGNAVVGGYTYSANFPTVPGSFDVSYYGARDAFVTKLNADGSALLYSTYLGGSLEDYGVSLAVDPDGSVYFTGYTYSSNFPTTVGAFDVSFNGGGDDVFVTKLNASGSSLIYSTFIGGKSWESTRGLGIDANGNAYLTGYTISGNFPTTPGSYDTSYNGGASFGDAFVTKLNSQGSGLAYSTFLGGTAADYGTSIIVDEEDCAYLTGWTISRGFPTTPGAFDVTHNGGVHWGGIDSFLTKLSASGDRILLSTFLGGDGDDWGNAITLDSMGNVYTAGNTSSSTFPTTPEAVRTIADGYDAYFTKLNATGDVLHFSTLLGGSTTDKGTSITLDPFGNHFVTGVTASTDFPTTKGALNTTHNGAGDIFIVKFDATDYDFLYSTFLGGSDSDSGYGMSSDSRGDIYVTGPTWSADFPVTPGAFDTSHNGGAAPNNVDAFILKLSLNNTAPEILSFTATVAQEGSAVDFTVDADDAQGDPLTYSFDFDSDGIFDVSGPNNFTSFTWGDDYAGIVTLQVDDGELDSSTTTSVFITNVAPALGLTIIPSGDEGESLQFQIQATDPGSDDITYSWWGHCNGWSPTSILYPNDPIIVPDPDPSPDINPRNVTDTQSITCGDDGTFQWDVQVEDDDGGVTTMSGTFDVFNRPPEYAHTFCPQIVGCFPNRYEGASTEYWVILEDAGSDDIGLLWVWGDGTPSESEIYYNDGVGPDPPDSPNGTFPFLVEDNRSHSYGDDGAYTISVDSEDDDGGHSPISAEVTILNLPPSLTVSPPQVLAVDEGTEVKLNATAADVGSDDIIFSWSWEYGKNESAVFYNDGIGPDPPDSPTGVFPFYASDNSTHTYGDDCRCNVTLTVEDDDGGILTYTTTIDVLNLPPSITEGIQAYTTGDLTLRIAGEKWHDVELKLFDGGNEIANVSVVRYPGSPDEQSATIENVTIDFLNDTLSAIIEYTPMDDPVNGQVWGATPAWLIFTLHDGGGESRLHHTFNVRHSDTWIWTVDSFAVLLTGVNIKFEGRGSDVGSDDLRFTWDWGDGEFTSTTYWNNMIGPDPYPSPEINPISILDEQNHAFQAAGTYLITLIVEDDDGGKEVAILNFVIS